MEAPRDRSSVEERRGVEAHFTGLLLAIVVLALLVRIPNLGESIWYDELWSTHAKLATFRQVVDTVRWDVHPPAYTVFMFAWIEFFGDSELSVRTPPLLCGLGSIALTGLLMRRWLGAPAALLTALMLSLNIVHIWYSQEARHYSALILLVLLSVYAYVRASDHEQQDRTWALIASLGMISACLVHYYAIAFAGIIGAFAFAQRRRHARTVIAGSLVALASVAAFMLLKRRFGHLSTSLSYLGTFDLRAASDLVLEWLPTGNALVQDVGDEAPSFSPLRLGVRALLAIVLGAGLWRLLATPNIRRISDTLLLLACAIALPAMVGLMGLVGMSGTYIERSILPMQPFYIAILAAAATGWRTQGIRLAVMGTITVIWMASLWRYAHRLDEWTVYKPNADFRAAAAFLGEGGHSQPRPAPIITMMPSDELEYYNRRFRIHRHHDGTPVAEQQAAPADRLNVFQLGPTPHPAGWSLLVATQPTELMLIHNHYWSGRPRGV